MGRLIHFCAHKTWLNWNGDPSRRTGLVTSHIAAPPRTLISSNSQHPLVFVIFFIIVKALPPGPAPLDARKVTGWVKTPVNGSSCDPVR
eukprot:1325513-Prymnesium_polylepis.1